MLGEFGQMRKNDWSDEFLTELTLKFYAEAVEKGYSGGFFWMYGYVGSGEALTLIDQKGDLRPTALALRYESLDREYEKSGYEGLDKPAFFYTENNGNVKWFGSRGAESYVLERSENKNDWTLVAEIGDEDVNFLTAPGMFSYADVSREQGKTYYYRVTAKAGAESAMSDVSQEF